MLKDTLLHQFNMTYFVIRRNLEGIESEDVVIRVGDDGANINWILGHILATRNVFIALLGGEPFWSDEQRARFASKSDVEVDAAQAMPLAQMEQALEQSQEQLQALLGACKNEDLTAAPENGPPLGIKLGGFAFHESYHAGQIGIMRRVIGLSGTL